MRNLRGKIETASFDGVNNFFFNICIQNYDKFGIWEGQMFLRYKRKNISFTIQLLRQKWKKKGFKFRYLNCSTPGSGFSTYANITYCYIPRCILSHDFIFCGKVCYMYRFHSRASEINNYMTLFSHRVKKSYQSFFLFGTCFSFILAPIAKFKNVNLSLCSLLKE